MQFLTIGFALAFVGVFPAIVGFVKIQAIENKFKETATSFSKSAISKKAQGSFKRLKKEPEFSLCWRGHRNGKCCFEVADKDLV